MELKILLPRVHGPKGYRLPLRAGGPWSGGVVTGGSPRPYGCRCTSQGETRLHLRAGSRCCKRGGVTEGSRKSSGCGSTHHGELGGLSVPVVAAQDGGSLRGVENPAAAVVPATGQRLASLCRWSLLGRGGH